MHQGKPHSGVALVVTLFLLVLLAVMAVGLLQIASSERGGAERFSKGLLAEVFAESALRIVESQILEGSSQNGTAWISQPGALRTFDLDGRPAQTFKLYSAQTMVEDASFDPNNNVDLPPADWDTAPNVWCDLNMAVEYGGRKFAPILQGSLFDTNANGTVSSSLVEGISINPARINDQGNANAHVPLPVRWIYQLTDGTLVSPEPAADGRVRLPGSRNNPPVARFAFWADDETSKLNINTAADGAFWDTPVTNSWNFYNLSPINRPIFEADIAYWQPSQREYQRYPGHPATTSLAPVFGRRIAQLAGITDPIDLRERLISLSPSYRPFADATGSRNSRSGTRPGQEIIDFKTDPFYATTDELAFSSNATGRTPRNLGNEAAMREMVEWSRFFTTSSSRAPEVNLFGEPRVAMWPVHTNPARQTPFDRLIAFCSTLDRSGTPQKFYLTRTNPLNGTDDWNADNRALYSYLQSVTGRNVPGFAGSSFLGKYGPGTASPDGSGTNPSERDQILTMMLDYIRCANLQPQDGTAYTTVNATGAGQVVPLLPQNGTRGLGRMASISELVLTACRRTRHTSDAHSSAASTRSSTFDYEIAVVPEFYSALAGYSTLWPNMEVEFSGLSTITCSFTGGNNTGYTGNPFSSDTHTLLCRRMMRDNEDNWKTGGPMGNLLGIVNSTDSAASGMPYQTFPHASISINGSASSPSAPTNMTMSSGSITVRVYVPQRVGGVLVSETSFAFPSFTFRAPTPPASTSGGAPYVPNSGSGSLLVRSFAQTASGSDGARILNVRSMFRTDNATTVLSDVARSLVPVGSGIRGDARFLSAFANTTPFFGPIEGYDATSGLEFFVRHTLAANSNSGSSFYQGMRMGSLISSVSVPSGGDTPTLPTYKIHTRPDVPPGIQGVAGGLSPGDWDNGPWQMPDGAYVNKVDEGSTVGNTGSFTSPDGSRPESIPYVGEYVSVLGGSILLHPTRFSPNRQIPSPAILGSIPTGIARVRPWQTLLFRPELEELPGGMSHPGADGLPDHALLDLFWMPVVEPYPISDPFSTAGKVNLNHRILPFSYLERTTALRGVLAGTQITALNPDLLSNASPATRHFIYLYKDGGSGAVGDSTRGFVSRRAVDADNTLKILNDRFASSGSKQTTFFDRNRDVTAFVSESEICEVPLVPANPPAYPNLNMPEPSGFSAITPASAARGLLNTFWSRHRLTGDNSLERPYTQLYSRLTTRSNTYQVHVWAESLTRVPDSEEFGGGVGSVSGRFRAAVTIERYLEPETTRHTPGTPLGPYKIRVLDSRRIQ